MILVGAVAHDLAVDLTRGFPRAGNADHHILKGVGLGEGLLQTIGHIPFPILEHVGHFLPVGVEPHISETDIHV